jgi:hypothetical protein
MKTELLRLVSVVPHGVGGPEAGMINLIYTFLLQDMGMTAYNYIGINQIGIELDELILKEKNNIHINIRYPSDPDFENKDSQQRNLIRLKVIHTALLRLADFENKLDKGVLEIIKQKVLESDFSFAFVFRIYSKRTQDGLGVQLLISPTPKCFNFILQFIDVTGKEKVSLLIYKGRTTTGYLSNFFKTGKWKSNQEFVLFGYGKDVQIKVFPDKGTVDVIYLSKFDKSAVFEMMRSALPKREEEEAYKNWIQSLPSNISKVIESTFNESE